MAQCRSCPATIVWAETEAKGDKPGRKIPLDADGRTARVVPDGNIIFTGATTGDGTPIVRMVGNGKGKHVTHFATCPNRGQHRRPR